MAEEMNKKRLHQKLIRWRLDDDDDDDDV